MYGLHYRAALHILNSIMSVSDNRINLIKNVIYHFMDHGSCAQFICITSMSAITAVIQYKGNIQQQMD